MSNSQEMPPMFTSFSGEDEPTWRERLMVVALFGGSGALAGLLSALLPVVELAPRNVLHAALASATAALLISGRFVVAARKADHFRVTALSLFLFFLGYLSFAIWLYVLPSETNFDGMTEGTFGMAVLLACLALFFTWPVYLPAALLSGHLVAKLVREGGRRKREAVRERPRSVA